MKKQTTRAETKPAPRVRAAPKAKAPAASWGARWHAGNFRAALCLTILAIAFALSFGQGSVLGQWYLRDGYVATRATIVKAPFWADTLAPNNTDDAIAGWHVELRVGEYPFTLPVALADFDPDKIYTQQGVAPAGDRFAVGSVHPVWFYDDNRKKQPETVSLLQSVPALVISRAAFGRFPSLSEAMEQDYEVLIAPAILLALAALYLFFAFFGKRWGNTSGSSFVARATWAGGACVVAVGAYLVTNEHPLASHSAEYTPAEIEITRGPLPIDQLTSYRGYRVLWRTWQVQGRLATPGAREFTIDVDGLDPHRTTWASRHSPDFSAFQPGSKLPVWRSGLYGAKLDNPGPLKPVISWDSYLSRERWPEKYTLRDYAQDNPVGVVIIAAAMLFALALVIPLGGNRAQ